MHQLRTLVPWTEHAENEQKIFFEALRVKPPNFGVVLFKLQEKIKSHKKLKLSSASVFSDGF